MYRKKSQITLWSILFLVFLVPSCQSVAYFMNPTSAMTLSLPLIYSHDLVLLWESFCKDFYYSGLPNYVSDSGSINKPILQFKLCVSLCWWAFIINFPITSQTCQGPQLGLEIYQTMAPIYFKLWLSSISRCYCLMVQSGPRRRCTRDVCFPVSVSFSCCAEPVSCLDFPPSYAPSAQSFPQVRSH